MMQVVTIIHVVLVLFIIIAGFVKSNPANLRPFAPMGARGIFNGAAIVFFRCVLCSLQSLKFRRAH